MSSPPRSDAPAPVLGVVFVQEQGGDGALARVLAHLGAAGVRDPAVVIVDRSRPAEWVHRVTPRMLHVGAADAGATGSVPGAIAVGADHLARADATAALEPLLVVTERFAELDDAALDLVDAYAFETCRRAAVALGLVESGREPWSGGLLLLPAGAAPALGRERDAEPPDVLGVELFDLRLVRRLRDGLVQPGSLDAGGLARLAAVRGAEGGEQPRIEPAGWIDHAELPETIRHGESAAIVVRGWVIDTPMPPRVLLRAAGREVARVALTIRRADVFAANPGLANEVCGFEYRGRIGPLPPGVQDLEWVADGSLLRGRVGSFRVLPAHTLELGRVLAPARRPPDVPPVVVVEGRITATAPGVAIEAQAGADKLAVRRMRALPGAGRDRPAVIEFVAVGRSPGSVGRKELEIVVRSSDPAGGADRATVRVASVPDPEAAVPSRLERSDVGHFEPRLGVTPVAFRGIVFGTRPSDRVGLFVGRRLASEVPLASLDVGEGALGIASFAIEDRLSGLGVGSHDLELALLGAKGERGALARWRQEVTERAVRVVAEAPQLERHDPRSSAFRVVLEGRLDGAELVDSLALAIDGVVRTRLGGEWLLPAAASDGASATWHRFRFDADMPLEAGRRELEIRVRRGAVESVAWSGELEVAAAAEPELLRIRSVELDRLLREDTATVWSRLVLEGELIGDLADPRAILRLNGRRAAEAPVGPDRSFRLEVSPEGGGTLEGAVEIESRAAVKLRSPTFRVRVLPLVVPAGAVAAMGRLVPRLLEGGLAALGANPVEVLRRALERVPGRAGDLLTALESLARRAEEADVRPATIVETDLPPLDRRLSVLLASWEIPCSRTGGGVCMVNLLRHLGERHEVTLLHTVAPGEEGLSEQVRPFVRDILTARREWRPSSPHRDFGVPEAFARNASERVRELVEVEAASGRYDLVNYEFNPMMMHASAWTVPSLGVYHEVHGFARAAAAPERFAAADEAAEWLEGAIGALHFETASLAGRIPELAVLTRPEAAFLARFLPGRRIFVNPIPIDVAALAAAAASARRAETPTFVFVGNYVHPPNREGAAIFAGRIAPAVLAARPDCRFVVVGAGAPAEVLALARPGVEIAGFVPDLAGLLAGATAFLAPLFTGGGMRVKLLEAMACGCPVVSSTLGLAGIDAVPEQDVLVADSVDEFVAAALRLAGAPPLVRRLGEAGRAVVERDHGIAVQGERRERIWRAVLDGARGRDAG